MKFTTVLIALTAISLFLSTFMFISWTKERRRRIQSEQATISIATFKDSIKSYLVLTTKQIQKIYPEMEQRLKDEFNVKLKNVLSLASTKVITNQTFKTFVKDSLNYKLDTIPFKYIAYKDSFIDFEASEIQTDFFVTRNISQVPLLQVVSREPWKLRFILPWNCSKIAYTATSYLAGIIR
jgi:hypothetical protein